MRALKQIAIMLMVSMLFSCGVKVKTAKMKPEEEKQIAQIIQKHKQQAEKQIDKKQLKEELEEKNPALEFAKAYFTGLAEGTVGGLITGNSAGGMVVGTAIDIALKKAMNMAKKKTYAIVPMYVDKNLKTTDCRFQIVAKFRNEKEREGFERFFGYDNSPLLKRIKKVDYVKERLSNKLVFYLAEFYMPSRLEYSAGTDPFINAIADVVIDGKLAGRYYLYGNALRALLIKDLNRKNLIDILFRELKGFLPYVVPKTFCAEDTKEARK